MKTLLIRVANKLGYELAIRKLEDVPKDMGDQNFEKLYQICRPYTMTQVYRMFSLYCSVKYIVKNNIPGDIVECGVWQGGSSMLIALALQELGDTSRNLYMYDTYEGMSEPTEKDTSWKYQSVKDTWEKTKKNGVSEWCFASIDDVKRNMYSTKYPKEKLHFIKGKVEDTIPQTIPQQVALLRLDTDWYESTYHELVHLYPLVPKDGIVLLDDYGFWKGSKLAVDEYFAKNNLNPLLNRIDGSGRVFIKH